MTSLPPNYRIASAGRRFCATLVNSVMLGMLVMIAETISAMAGAMEDQETATRTILIGCLIVYWIVCAFKKSPGAMLCMLQRYSTENVPLKRGAALVGSAPFLVVGIVAYFPMRLLPREAALFHPWFVFLGGAIILADGLAVLVSKRSLTDRWFRTTVLHLSLPDRMMPTFFGIRLM